MTGGADGAEGPVSLSRRSSRNSLSEPEYSIPEDLPLRTPRSTHDPDFSDLESSGHSSGDCTSVAIPV